MLKLRIWLLLSCLLMAAAPVWAQSANPGKQRPTPIHFTAAVKPMPARTGEIVTVTVNATVDEGWHVYSVVPTPGGPGATDILSAGDWTPAAATTEDTPERKFDSNFNLDVGLHEKTATFSRQFRIPTSASVAPATPVTITLHYQTCNSRICLPPTNAAIPTSVAVEAGPTRAEYASPVAVAAPPAVSASAHMVRKPVERTGLALFLLAALGAGLLSIATPCVFPLIPITLTSFVKQANGDKLKLMRLSTGYALGIVALYVFLGAVVSATLGAAGANKLAANPWVNLVEFVVFVIFALSFFETITLTLPGNLSNMQMAARRHGGTAGLILLGITFVLASFTCTAPFVGSLLVAAAGGEKVRPFLGMLVFALAFSSPFFFFGAFPQWISRIPKSGVWLARAKATLGFVELAAALKFLSNVDMVWKWQILTQPVLLAAWAIIFTCAGLYLLNVLRFGMVAETETEAQRRKIPVMRKVIAAAFFAVTLYTFWGLSGRPLNPIVGSFLPPAGYGGVASADEGLPFLTDYDAALAQAKAENKPLFIDFTGVFCTNCRLNEKNLYPRDEVKKEMAKYVRVQLYTDSGKDGPKNQELQQSKFGDIALPLYGVVNPQSGAVVDQVAGVITPTTFLSFLRNAHTTVQAAAPLAPIPAVQRWAAYSPEAVAEAARQGKPVIVDFTADWCVNCKQIAREVFDNAAVTPVLDRDYVTLRADLTQWDAPASAALQKQYGFNALPTIILLDKSGKENRAQRINGRVGVEEFLKRLTAASG